MSKAFVMDDEHWVTINGNHVLINEKGEVQAGLGGKFTGRRISKFSGVPSREKLQNAYGENGVDIDKAYARKREIEGSKEYKKADREATKLGKDLDKNKYWYNTYKPDTGAEVSAEYERNKDKMSAMTKGVNEKIKSLKEKEKGLRKAIQRSKKNERFTNVTERAKKLAEHVSNAKYNRINREMKTKAKADAIEAKYNKMAERIEKRYPDNWERENLARNVAERGREKADNIRREARTGLTWSNRKNDTERRNSGELNYRERQIKALNKVKDKENRRKLANAAGANAYMKERGTKVSKATPDMVGGRFVKPTEEAKSAENMAKTYERRYWSTGQRDENLTYAKSARRVANAYKKNEENARNALAKARPKIAERRQAIRNAVANGTAKKNLEQTHTYNGQPFRVLNYGGNGRNALHSIITKSDEDTAKKYGDAYAARHVETWQLDKK